MDTQLGIWWPTANFWVNLKSRDGIKFTNHLGNHCLLHALNKIGSGLKHFFSIFFSRNCPMRLKCRGWRNGKHWPGGQLASSKSDLGGTYRADTCDLKICDLMTKNLNELATRKGYSSAALIWRFKCCICYSSSVMYHTAGQQWSVRALVSKDILCVLI